MLTPSRGFLRYWRGIEHHRHAPCCRQLTNTATAFSGHSKWSKIKHDKAVKDARKNKGRTLVAREISNAVKYHGGADPRSNNRLAAAISKAKGAGMLKNVIDANILRGQGKSSTGAALETMTLEAMIPPVGIIIEAETDSRGRTLSEVRHTITKRGGQVAPALFLFEQRGRVVFAGKDGAVDADSLMDPALEFGATDLEETPEDPGTVIVYAEPSGVAELEKLAESQSLEIRESGFVWYPKQETLADVTSDEMLSQLHDLVEALEECADVQAVYTNIRT